MNMIELLKFILFLIAYIMVPGWIALRAVRLKIDLLGKTGLSFCLGVSFLIFSTLLLRIVGFPYQFLHLIGIISSLGLLSHIRTSKHMLKYKFSSFSVIAIFIWTVLSITMVSFHLGSKVDPTVGFMISAGRDNFWRLSIMQELTNHFPPQIPGFAGSLLKNYHFLYDLLIATTHQITKISLPILHFQLYSLALAMSFCVLSYIGAKIIISNKWVALLTSILTVGTGNLSYLLRFISSKFTFVAKSNIFLADSPFDQSHNPFNMLAYALFLSVLIFLVKWRASKNNKQLIYIAIITAVLFGVKIYAGLLVLGATLVMFGYLLIKKEGSIWFGLPIVTLLPVFQVMRGNSFSILSWNPGWVLMKLIEDSDRLYSETTILKLQHYRQTHNVIRIVETYARLLGIYLIGNLNIRLLAFAVPFRKKWLQHIPSSVRLWILSATVAAFGVPLLFSQNRAPYDSIQFVPYGMILMSLVSGVVIEHMLLYIKKPMLKVGVVVVLLMVALPTNIVVAWDHLMSPKDIISKYEVDTLTYLQNESNVGDIVLTDLEEDKMYLMYVPAISGRRVFLSGTSLTEQLGIDTKSRREQIESFFQNYSGATVQELEEKQQFLTKSNIKYIYLSNTGLVYEPLMKSLNLTLSYRNVNAVIYTVK